MSPHITLAGKAAIYITLHNVYVITKVAFTQEILPEFVALIFNPHE